MMIIREESKTHQSTFRPLCQGTLIPSRVPDTDNPSWGSLYSGSQGHKKQILLFESHYIKKKRFIMYQKILSSLISILR